MQLITIGMLESEMVTLLKQRSAVAKGELVAIPEGSEEVEEENPEEFGR